MIELMVTLAIASLLTMAAFAVTANLWRSQQAAQEDHDQAMLRQRLQDILRVDLCQMQNWQVTDKGIALQSMVALSEKDMDVRHLPVTVYYEILPAGSGTVLVRRQMIGTDQQTNIVCPDVQSIRLEAKTRQENPGPPASWRPRADGMVAIVVLGGAAPGELSLDFQFR